MASGYKSPEFHSVFLQALHASAEGYTMVSSALALL